MTTSKANTVLSWIGTLGIITVHWNNIISYISAWGTRVSKFHTYLWFLLLPLIYLIWWNSTNKIMSQQTQVNPLSFIDTGDLTRQRQRQIQNPVLNWYLGHYDSTLKQSYFLHLCPRNQVSTINRYLWYIYYHSHFWFAEIQPKSLCFNNSVEYCHIRLNCQQYFIKFFPNLVGW